MNKTKLPAEISHFIDNLSDYSGKIYTHPPISDKNEWWIHFEEEKFTASVVWQQNIGFGLYNCSLVFGYEHPENFYLDPIIAAYHMRLLINRKRIINSFKNLSDVMDTPLTYVVDDNLPQRLNKTSTLLICILILFFGWLFLRYTGYAGGVNG